MITIDFILLFIFHVFRLPHLDGQLSHVHINFRFELFQRKIDHLILQAAQFFKAVSARTISSTDHPDSMSDDPELLFIELQILFFLPAYNPWSTDYFYAHAFLSFLV